MIAWHSHNVDNHTMFRSHTGLAALPSMDNMKELEEALLALFFPEEYTSCRYNALAILRSSIISALRYCYPDETESTLIARTDETLKRADRETAKIRKLLNLDAEAGFSSDPAAHSIDEIILCYPAIRALTMHRCANFLYKEGIPLIPRMMNEEVHSATGIDINPGATLGESFFIDHGTGVVIGETTIIGNNVKLYQGVTLGALSIPKKGCGQLLEGAKRHPTIEDNVTIYANATILGDITIGHDTIIASNSWIRDSIPPCSMVRTSLPEIKVRPIKRNQK